MLRCHPLLLRSCTTQATSILWVIWMASVSCSAQTLVIGLYDYSDLTTKETADLTETTGLAFGHAGIHIVWRYCRGPEAAESRTTCEGEIPANEIVVRLQPDGARTSNDDWTPRLGQALVTAEGGSYASVFVPAVRSQAARLALPFGLLLGYAVAHEVGHCLLGPGHSYTGLMRSVWNRNDAGEMSRLSLHLTKQEARKVVARVSLAEAAARR
jgi:hypothetical protein